MGGLNFKFGFLYYPVWIWKKRRSNGKIKIQWKKQDPMAKSISIKILIVNRENKEV